MHLSPCIADWTPGHRPQAGTARGSHMDAMKLTLSKSEPIAIETPAGYVIVRLDERAQRKKAKGSANSSIALLIEHPQTVRVCRLKHLDDGRAAWVRHDQAGRPMPKFRRLVPIVDPSSGELLGVAEPARRQVSLPGGAPESYRVATPAVTRPPTTSAQPCEPNPQPDQPGAFDPSAGHDPLTALLGQE